MGSYGNIIDFIWVPYLDLYPFAERREQLGEDDLLIPYWFITAFLDWSLSLEKGKGIIRNYKRITEKTNTFGQL